MNADTARPFVVVPCLNEAGSIGRLLQRILAHSADVIVIDDGSSDATAEIVARLPVTLIRHAERRGKGEALRSGFREALRRGASGVLTLDGDGQHDPADIPRMLDAVRRHPDTLVIGARMLARERQSRARRITNAFADWGISWGCGQPVADTQSGLRWYPRSVVAAANLASQDFVFEAAILIAASREQGLPIVSIPIACQYHATSRRSHFRPVRDVLRITFYTVARVVHYGQVVQSYLASHGNPATILDPDARQPLPQQRNR